nr:hypothetical protein [Tanacetum cinerariifolium]
MANLEFVAQHNMVECLAKTEGNLEFHEIVYFLTSSTIHHALTVSLTIYTSYIEQFWNTASSQTLNDDKQIHATIDRKAVVVTEASIRSSLLFNDADGTTYLTNDAIFQNLAMMGYEEGEGLGAPIEPQPAPFPTHPSTGDQPYVTESSSTHDTTQYSRDSLDLEGTNGSEGDQVQSPYDSPLSGGHTSNRAEGALILEGLFSICTNLSNRVLALETVNDAQAAEIIALKARIKKLKKKFGKKEFVSKQGRKKDEKDKPKPTLDDSTFDADHGMENIDTEEPVNKGRLIEETEELVSTARPEDSTVRPDVGTADPIAPPPSTTNIKDSSRPARSILTLKPLPTIDPKDKGKGVLEEPEPAKKMIRSDLDAAQIAKDVKVAILVYEEELAELKREKEKRQREEEASKAAIAKMYDEVQARIKVDELFAAKLQQEERDKRIDNFKPMDSDDAVHKEKVLEEPESTKIEVKQEGDKKSIRKIPGKRLKMKATKKSKLQKIDSDLKEEEHLKTFMQIVPDKEGEVDYEVLDKIFPIINWESKFYHLDKHGAECIYYRIFRSDGSSRWIKTFSKMVTRFDRMDIEELYNLVMQRFETTSPEGVDLVCKIQVKYRSFHSIRAKARMIPNGPSKGPRQSWTTQAHLVGPSLGYKYPLLALGEG